MASNQNQDLVCNPSTINPSWLTSSSLTLLLLLLLSLLHSFLLNRKSLSLSLSLSNQIPNFISLISLLLLPFQFLLAKSIKERKNQYINFILWDFAVSSAAIRRTQDQERISPILQALDVLWIHHSEVSIHFKRDYTVSFTLNG